MILLQVRIFFANNKSQRFNFQKNISLVKYKRNLCNYDYKKAYNSRVSFCLEMLRTSDAVETKDKILNYLNVIYDRQVFDFLGLEDADINFIETSLNKNSIKLVRNACLKKESVGNVLLLGPGIDFSEINIQNYDLVVLNKPIESTEFCNSCKNIIVIPNNTWCKYKKKELYNFLKLNSNASIIPPLSLDKTYPKSSAFLSIPHYIFGGLQGLQRNLVVIGQTHNAQSITVRGFNFFLEKEAYKNWYPSLLDEEYGTKRAGIYIASMNHDYLLNISFVKKYLNQICDTINGDLSPYLQKKNVDLLESFYFMYQNDNPVTLDLLNRLTYAKYRNS